MDKLKITEAMDKINENFKQAFKDEYVSPCENVQEDQNDIVKEPEHYKHGQFEVIDEMIIMFGWEATVVFCKINAWKYRARAPYKGKMEEDLRKADRYLEYARDIELANNGGTDILLKE